MQIKNADLEVLARVLSLLGSQTHPSLVYFVARNTAVLSPALQALAQAKEPRHEYAEYEQRHLTLCLAHAKLDAEGHPISRRVETVNGSATQYAIVDQQVFDVAMDALNATYRKTRKEFMLQQADIFKLMRETTSLGLLRIKVSACPPNSITADIAAVLTRLGLLEWDVAPSGVVEGCD